MRQIPELLAPVGGKEQLRAAVENGADAVYMGGRAFHARANAECFSGEALKEAVLYAHSKGVRVYITLNTLVTNEELKEALSEAEECSRAGVDGLIVQDFGLAEMLRRKMPEMELHLSTQATIYNQEGVLKAKELGFSRVVLARETPFSHIAEIAASTKVPLEVFVHGAICMCYSGQCQMSRFQGGRSGNRGGCAQPCRLPYALLKNGAPFSEKNQNQCGPYRLSPKDMCTVDHLGRLAEAGVASLKIEGRMKSPEYVAVVTGIYRKYLDIYQKEGSYEVSSEDRKALLQIFNRGGFTDGYLWENPRRRLLADQLPKHQGIFLGTVVGVKTVGQGESLRQLLTVRLKEDIHLGDGVEVWGSERGAQKSLAGNIVTYIGEDCKREEKTQRKHTRPQSRRESEKTQRSVLKKSMREARAGQTVEIGDIPGEVKAGQRMYRISEKEQLKKARDTFEIKSGQAKKESRKLPVLMELSVREGQPVRLTVTMAHKTPGADVLTAEAVSEQFPQRAIQHPMTEEGARRQLEKTGDTMFFLKELRLKAEDGLMVKASTLNQLRRESLRRLTELWEESQSVEGRFQAAAIRKEETKTQEEKSLKSEAGAVSAGKKTLYLFRADEEMLRLAQDSDYDRLYVSCQVILDEKKKDSLKALAGLGKQVFGWLPPVSGEKESRWIEEKKAEIVFALKEISEGGLCVNNLGQLRLFSGCGLRLYGDYGLNFYNDADFAWAKEQGLSGGVLSHEAFDNGFANPLKELPHLMGIEGEAAVAGRIPLMVSAHCPIADGTGCPGLEENKKVGKGACDGANYALRDRKNREYPILTEKMDCRVTIFSQSFSLPAQGRLREIQKAGYHVRTYGIDKSVFLD